MSQQGINKIIVLGHAGGDAEVKNTSGGKAVANFSVAVNESFKNSNGDNVDRVEWFRCVAWNGLAEVVGQYVTRGKQVYLEGRIQSRKYEDKQGQTRTVTEVVVSTLRLLGGSRAESAARSEEMGAHPTTNASAAPESMEDCPF